MIAWRCFLCAIFRTLFKWLHDSSTGILLGQHRMEHSARRCHQRGGGSVNSSPVELVRVLFVDDEPTIRETCPAILRKHNFEVTSVGTVADALAENRGDSVRCPHCRHEHRRAWRWVHHCESDAPGAPELWDSPLTGHPAAETALLAFRYQVDDDLLDGIISKGEGPEALLARVDRLIARNASRNSAEEPPPSES